MSFIIPSINALSITKSKLISQKDSTANITVVIYDGAENLNKADTEKPRNWLNERLAVKDVELFKKH